MLRHELITIYFRKKKYNPVDLFCFSARIILSKRPKFLNLVELGTASNLERRLAEIGNAQSDLRHAQVMGCCS